MDSHHLGQICSYHEQHFVEQIISMSELRLFICMLGAEVDQNYDFYPANPPEKEFLKYWAWIYTSHLLQ